MALAIRGARSAVQALGLNPDPQGVHIEKDTTMNTHQTVDTTPVAPAQGEQGVRLSHGGHIQAYKAQASFAPTATLELISGTNPWRRNTLGHDFYVKVLGNAPKTVADALAIGAKAGLKARDVQGHLRWLYTWGGSYIRIAGNVYSPPVAPVSEPVAPKAEKPAKVRKSK